MEELLNRLPAMLLVNLFWGSLLFIGFVLLVFARDDARLPRPLRTLGSFALQQQLVLRVLIALASSFALFAVLIIPCYILQLPIVVLAVLYAVVLGAAGGFMLPRWWRALLAKRAITIQYSFPLRAPAVYYLTLLGVGGALAVVGLDYAINAFIGSEAQDGSDAYVHVAKILTLVQQGFSLDDGFFSGIVESRYHVNIVHALYALGAYVTGSSPADVWRYSLGFFRLLVWASFFTVAYHACAYWFKDKGRALFVASVTLIVTFARFSDYFYVANYPNEIVVAWIALLIVGLSLYEAGKIGVMLPLIAAFLATMTHPTYALMTAAFVGLLAAIKLIVQRRQFWLDRRSLLLYGACFGVLMAAPVVTLLFPDRMTDASFSFGYFTTTDIAGLSILKPAVPMTALAIAIWAVCSLGFVSMLYLLRRDTKQLLIVIAILLFFPLIAYNPLTFGTLHEHLPLWMIDRFRTVNLLTFVALGLGTYAVARLAGWAARTYLGQPEARVRALQYAAILVLAAAWSLHWVGTTYRATIKHREQSNAYYAFLDRTEATFAPHLSNNDTVVATLGDSYFVPSAVSIDVISIYEAHATPVAAIADRNKCQERLMKDLSYADLKAVNADYVLLARYDRTAYAKEEAKVAERPYLRHVAQNNDFALFAFDAKQRPDDPGLADKACLAYQKEEQ
jgi:hypothetical protein